MEDDAKLPFALEYEGGMIIPDGMRVHDIAGNTIFNADGKRYCVLEKHLIYRVDLDCPVEEIGNRLKAAVDDFNAKTGTALLFASST